MNRIILLTFVFLISCLSKPNQPALTIKEEKFIKSLREKFNCEASREVDIMLLERFAKTHKTGGYTLILNLKCDSLKWFNKNRDITQSRIDELIYPLYFGVLDSASKFNHILISLTCPIDLKNSSNYQNMHYEYKTDSLINPQPN